MKKITAALVACLAVTGLAQAQDYPNRAVRLIVPYAAGGAPDVFARVIGQRIPAIRLHAILRHLHAMSVGIAERALRMPVAGLGPCSHVRERVGDYGRYVSLLSPWLIRPTAPEARHVRRPNESVPSMSIALGQIELSLSVTSDSLQSNVGKAGTRLFGLP